MSSILLYLLRLSHLRLSFLIFTRCNIQTKSRLPPDTLSIVASSYVLSFVQEKMFEQNPVSKLLKNLLIEIERFRGILFGFHRENVCLCTKKGVKPLLKVDIQHDWTMIRTIDII